MSRPVKVSVKDLVAKWRKPLSIQSQTDIPFKMLELALKGLSEDSHINRDLLRQAIVNRNLFDVYKVLEESVVLSEYDTPDLLLQDRLVAEIFSKYPFPNSPFDKRQKALLRFWEAEELCRETNIRLATLKEADGRHIRIIDKAQRIIRSVLGDFSLDEMSRHSRFGPGACIGVNGAFTTPYFKYSAREFTVSPCAFPYVETLFNFDPFWRAIASGIDLNQVEGAYNLLPGYEPELSIIEYNKVTFVPKNAKTERSIAIEPYFNIYFQLGIGAMIRKRLKRVGIDLDDQTRNQMLAKTGSLHNDLATIDFSMASDTVSRGLVKLLIPSDWYFHLDNLRSKFSRLDSVCYQNEKFSSMGNGYTFELESLIFYAIAEACRIEMSSSGTVSVFGDDVILPSTCSDVFVEISTYLGFKVNTEKSFFRGYFRESCGEDFLKGVPVRPVFCKELSTIADIGSLSNRLLELNASVGLGSRVDRIICDWVRFLRSLIPRDIRKHLVGPPSEVVDGYLFADPEELYSSELVKYEPRLFAWSYPTVRFHSREFRRSSRGVRMILNDSLKGPALFSKALRFWEMWNPLLGSCLVNEVTDSPRTSITARKVGNYVLGRSLAWSLG